MMFKSWKIYKLTNHEFPTCNFKLPKGTYKDFILMATEKQIDLPVGHQFQKRKLKIK